MRNRLLGALSVGCALAVASPAIATIVMELDIGNLTERSDAVVRGVVVKRESRLDADSEHIFTYTTLRIDSSLKGTGSSTIVIRQLGGEVEGAGFFIAGDAFFEVGEEVLVFLRRNPDGGPFFHLVGLSQGKYSVSRAGERPVAVRDLSDLSLGRFHDGRFVHRHATGPTALSLEDLEEAVAEAAR